MNVLNERDLQLHVTILAWLHLVGAALFLLGGVFLFTLLAGIGVASGEAEAIAILSVIGTALGLLLLFLALPGLAAGYGLLTHHAWGRILAIVVSILGLIIFPLGTLIGAYALWVLLQDRANDYFGIPKTA